MRLTWKTPLRIFARPRRVGAPALLVLAAISAASMACGSPGGDSQDSDEPNGAAPSCEVSDVDPSVFPPEAYRAGQLPDPLGETPRLLWQEESFCERADVWSDQDFAFGKTGIDGESRDVVVNANHVWSSPFGPVVDSIAVVDPDDGEAVRCNSKSLDDSTDNGRLDFVTATGEVYMVSSTDNSSAPDDYNHSWGSAWGHNVDTGETTLEWRFDYNDRRMTSSMLSLSPYGQVLVSPDDDELYAVDPSDGEVVWRKSVDEVLGADERNARIQQLYSTPDSTYVRVSFGDHPATRHMLLSIDGCGESSLVVAERDEPVWVWPFGAHSIVREGPELAISDSEMDPKHSMSCHGVVTLSDEEIACHTRSQDWRTRTVYTASIDDGFEQAFRLEAPTDGEFSDFRFDDPVVAGADRHLILSARATLADTNERFRRIYIVPVDEPENARTIDLVRDARGEFDTGTPLLLPDGKLIWAEEGRLEAIQTAVAGLSRSPYPRGLKLGGNENRGWVDVNAVD
jgi:hypothetical protein